MKLKILVSLFVLFMGGCAGKQVPMEIYTLHAPSHSMRSVKYRSKTLKLAYPRSIVNKAGYRMYYSYADSDQGSYQNSQWANAVGRLLQGVLMDTISQSRMFRAVLPYTSSLRENYRLESSIFDFSHHVRGRYSYAVVSIQFTLISVDTGRLLKSRRFSYREPTHTTNAKGYAEATNQIIKRLSSDLLQWL